MVDKEKVKEVLEKIRPQLQMDGGDVELVDITDDGIVKVRLQGHCAGCFSHSFRGGRSSARPTDFTIRNRTGYQTICA